MPSFQLQVLFNALVNSYYAGFIPCLFAQVCTVTVWWLDNNLKRSLMSSWGVIRGDPVFFSFHHSAGMFRREKGERMTWGVKLELWLSVPRSSWKLIKYRGTLFYHFLSHPLDVRNFFSKVSFWTCPKKQASNVLTMKWLCSYVFWILRLIVTSSFFYPSLTLSWLLKSSVKGTVSTVLNWLKVAPLTSLG